MFFEFSDDQVKLISLIAFSCCPLCIVTVYRLCIMFGCVFRNILHLYWYLTSYEINHWFTVNEKAFVEGLWSFEVLSFWHRWIRYFSVDFFSKWHLNADIQQCICIRLHIFWVVLWWFSCEAAGRKPLTTTCSRSNEKGREREKDRQTHWGEWQRLKTSIISRASSKWNYLALLFPCHSLQFSLEARVRWGGQKPPDAQSHRNEEFLVTERPTYSCIGILCWNTFCKIGCYYVLKDLPAAMVCTISVGLQLDEHACGISVCLWCMRLLLPFVQYFPQTYKDENPVVFL